MKKISLILIILLFAAKGLLYSEILPDSSLNILKNLDQNKQLIQLQKWAWELRFSQQVLALKYAREALALAKKLNNYESQAICYNYIGVIFLHQSDYFNAQIQFLESKKIAEKNNIDNQIGYALNNLGHVRIFKGEYKEAFDLIEQSVYYHEKANDKNGVAYSYIRLSEAFLKIKQYDSSQHYALKAVNLRKELGNKTNINKALMTLGDAKIGLGKYREALNIFYDIEDDLPEKSNIYNHMAFAYYSSGELDNAIKYAKMAYGLASEKKHYQYMMEACNILAMSNFNKKNFEDAYKYSIQITPLRDSLFNEERVKQMSLLEFSYDYESQKDRLTKLDNESNRNKIFTFSISAGFIILGLFTFILLYNRKKQRKSNQILTEKNKEIHLQAEKLHELNSTKDKFFSIIAHDLKNPLGSFKQMTEYLSSNFDDLSVAEQKEFLKLMNNSSGQIFHLLENLLEWSKSQRGLLQYQPTDFDLFFIVENLISLLKLNTSTKNIRISNLVPVNTMAYGDVNMTTTILRNLITNSIKFSDNGGKIIVSSEFDNNNTHVVSVKDFGIGIPKPILNKLFKIDSNISTIGTSSEKGTGLGLVICKEFIEKMGGAIWVESIVGKGSTFFFTLKKEN